jgi:uncharacterized protein YjbI with pentapeptide repeats
VRRSWNRGRAVTATLILFGLVLFGWVWWKLPPALYRGVAGDARIKAITDTRTALLAGLVGLGAIGTLWVNSRTYRVTARTFELTEQGHITERYTKAIEQLGSASLDVRLGGIYALERIAVDSARDHATVVEVLSAYVREHSVSERVATDVQAAATVLGRLPVRTGISRGNLSGARLRRGDLHKATLPGAYLFGASLPDAYLFEANLSGADLGLANVSDARLDKANLSRAWLFEANMSGALLYKANLSEACLILANLSGARLFEANLSDGDLQEANLSGARLDGANLTRAIFAGVDLSTTQGLSQSQLDAAVGDRGTAVPAALRRPAHWTADTTE